MRDHPFISPELISSYLPDSFGPDRTSRSLDLIDQVRTHIDQRLPLAFSYNGIDRVVIPASLYLQNATGPQSTKITPPKGYPHTMTVTSAGARRAVGLDALELMKGQDDEEGWKSYHIDRIKGLKLFTWDEVARIFAYMDRDRIGVLSQTIPGFIKNWNYWARHTLAERESKYDLRVPEHVLKEKQ